MANDEKDAKGLAPLSKPGPVGTKGPVNLGALPPAEPIREMSRTPTEQENEALRKEVERLKGVIEKRDAGKDATGLMQFNNVTNAQARAIRASKRGHRAMTPLDYQTAGREYDKRQSKAAKKMGDFVKTMVAAAGLEMGKD